MKNIKHKKSYQALYEAWDISAKEISAIDRNLSYTHS